MKFPLEYDAVDIATDELKEKLLPVSRKLKDVDRERGERRKVRKKTKAAQPAAAPAPAASSSTDVEMTDAAPATATAGGELEPEEVYREKEAKELEALVHPDLKKDLGASNSGLYDLVAIITHKGAFADGGHYIGFVKKSVFHPIKGSAAAAQAKEAAEKSGAVAVAEIEEDDEDWYKFDDDKVSTFPVEKIPTLEGGGEDSSAYVLLYKAKPLL